MKQESKALGIIAIVFGAIALLGSWIPIINNISFIFAILGLILGVIGLIVNRKRTKTLAIIGTVISVASVGIVIATQAMYSSALKNASDKIEKAESAVNSASSTVESTQKEENTKFNWTKEQYNALKQGDITKYGAGGTNYNDVIKEHGTPSSENSTSVNDRESKTISYTSTGSKIKNVTLTFTQQDDGSYLLINKIQTGLE